MQTLMKSGSLLFAKVHVYGVSVLKGLNAFHIYITGPKKAG